MRLAQACEKFNKLANIPFGDLFSDSDMKMIIVNKGKTGQLLELALGMRLSSKNLDFEDGELKTNKCDASGNPKETVFITQISSIIDDLIQKHPRPFEQTHLYEKISNILYVPVCKEGSPQNWMFLPSIHIDLARPQFAELYNIWENDYNSICGQLRHFIDTTGSIHTSNGKHIQVRSKDAKDAKGNYHPIYSHTYGKFVSNKNHAFYFQKQFVYDIRRMARQ